MVAERGLGWKPSRCSASALFDRNHASQLFVRRPGGVVFASPGSVRPYPPSHAGREQLNELDPKAIAARIRQIIGAQNLSGIEAVAQRLSLSEVALRMTIDPDEPHPTVEVMAAVAAYYGVDPVWLLSGDCDSAAHMAAIAIDGAGVKVEMARILARALARQTPSEGVRELRLGA